MHPLTGPRRTSPRRRRVPVGVAVCVSVLAATTVSAAVSSAVSSAGPEQAVSRSSADRSVQHRTPLAQNPLAGGGWGVYKGDADQYWSVAGRADAADIAWSYSAPFPAVGRITDRIAFYDELVDVRVDGQLRERPVSPFSSAANRPGQDR